MKNKRSASVEETQKIIIPAAEELLRTAAERVAPLVHGAAHQIGPLAHSAAGKVGPLAQSAAARVGPLAHSAADAVGPLAQSAAHGVTAATALVTPYATLAAEWAAPLAQQAVDRVTPYAQQAVGRVSPYAQQAVGAVTPYAQQAAVLAVPLAAGARTRGVQARDAVVALTPKLEEAVGKVTPALDAARGRLTEELLPKLGEVVSAAAATPLAVEATRRGRATLAAARGELYLPEPTPTKRGGILKRLLLILALAGIVGVVLRQVLGTKDDGWQTANPTTPYAPTQPAAAADDPAPAPEASAATDAASDVVADSDEAVIDDEAPGGEVDDLLAVDATETTIDTSPIDTSALDAGTSDDLTPGYTPGETAPGDAVGDPVPAELESDPELDDLEPIVVVAPVEDPDAVLLGDSADLATTDLSQNEAPDEAPDDQGWGDAALPPIDDEPTILTGVELGEVPAEPTDVGDDTGRSAAVESEDAVAETRYSGEGAYVGDAPPEGFFIKGNERSMKYHTPESGGYTDTRAEVWFNSEDAAQQAGFIRAQG